MTRKGNATLVAGIQQWVGKTKSCPHRPYILLGNTGVKQLIITLIIFHCHGFLLELQGTVQSRRGETENCHRMVGMWTEWPYARYQERDWIQPTEREKEEREKGREGGRKEWWKREGKGEVGRENRERKRERRKVARGEGGRESSKPEFLDPVVLDSAPCLCFQVETVNSSFVCEWTLVCVGFLLFEAIRVLANMAFQYWYKVEYLLEYQRWKKL